MTGTESIIQAPGPRPQGWSSRKAYNVLVEGTDPTVLWRLTKGREAAHATIFPGEPQTTIAWFVNGVMDRAEQYDSMDLALARSEEVRGTLVRDGWKEA